MYRKLINPIILSLLILGLIIVFSLINLLFESGNDDSSVLAPYFISSSFALLYALINSIILINSDDANKFWRYSVVGFFIIIIGGLAFSFLMTGVHPLDTIIYYQIYVVIIFGYLVFMAIAGLMKKLLEWAQNSK